MTVATPPIVRLAERLLVEVELAVSKWPRAHRYLSGADLRRAAMRVAKRALRAWRARDDKAAQVARLADAVDELKISLQVGMRLKAFRSFGQFEALARLSADVGRQVGGWLRQLQHPNGQNRGAQAPSERAKTLSTHAAPDFSGANP